MFGAKDRMAVDISGLKAYGAVLDLGYRSNGIIYRAIKSLALSDETAISSDIPSGSEETQWVNGLPEDMPFEDGKFDTVVSFFSMCLIDNKKERKRTVSEVARVLNEDGKFLIWDFNRRHVSMGFKKAIKVIIPGGDMIDMDITAPITWRGCSSKSLLPLVEKYFDISDLREYDGYFYIEALKKKSQIRDDCV